MITKTIQPFRVSIDKLSFTCRDESPAQVEESKHRLIKTSKAGLSGLQLKPGLNYHIQGTLPIMRNQNTLLVQVGSRRPKVSDYRFEFNPSKLGRHGLDEICSFIDAHFAMGAQALYANGMVTRIDIALDIDGWNLDEVVMRSLGQRKHGVYTGQYGQIETVYAGSTAKSRTVAYVKKADKETESDFLRLERRLKPYIRGRDLHEMPNPFTRVQVVTTSSLKPHLSGMIPAHFFDTVRMRGVNRATADLPTKQRKAIKAAFADPANSILPSQEEVWAQWSPLLHRTGIAALCIDTGKLEAAE